jgi:hypothetical protein
MKSIFEDSWSPGQQSDLALHHNIQRNTYLGAIDNMQIVGDRFASPGDRAPQWRHLRDMHDGANV